MADTETVHIIHRDVVYEFGYIVSVHKTKELAEDTMAQILKDKRTDPEEYDIQEWGVLGTGGD